MKQKFSQPGAGHDSHTGRHRVAESSARFRSRGSWAARATGTMPARLTMHDTTLMREYMRPAA
jgi:hypothetical protein